MIFQLCAIVAQANSALPTTEPLTWYQSLARGGQLPMILLAVMLFYFVMMRGNKKQDRAKKDRLAGMKKNDRVMTIGGILGTVVEVRDKEVVVKVDETNNTKMRFSRDAIRTVLDDEEKK